jgi:hypothetical protein
MKWLKNITDRKIKIIWKKLNSSNIVPSGDGEIRPKPKYGKTTLRGGFLFAEVTAGVI